MGLLSAYLHNVRANRGALLAFAINQREQEEAQKRLRQEQDERLWNALASGSFADSMAQAWDDKGGGGGVWAPPMPSSFFSEYPPVAPDPPPMPKMAQPQQAGQSESLSRVLQRMKGTSGRMAQGTGILGGAARPATRVK